MLTTIREARAAAYRADALARIAAAAASAHDRFPHAPLPRQRP